MAALAITRTDFSSFIKFCLIPSLNICLSLLFILLRFTAIAIFFLTENEIFNFLLSLLGRFPKKIVTYLF